MFEGFSSFSIGLILTMIKSVQVSKERDKKYGLYRINKKKLTDRHIDGLKPCYDISSFGLWPIELKKQAFLKVLTGSVHLSNWNVDTTKISHNSSKFAGTKLGSLATQWAHREDSDQTEQMPGLI